MNSKLYTKERQTKYCTAIEEILAQKGHATNLEILEALRVYFPDVSATTVHRATARLATRGKILLAPADFSGSMRYDSNTSPHDHFTCTECGILRDTDIKHKVVPILEKSIGDCSISGRITISGICKNCNKGSV
jgi:Fur family peroxide stress response transcriptional regulator